MSFDVREKWYTSVGPGTVGHVSSGNGGDCMNPHTNLVNNNVYEEFWEGFEASRSLSAGTWNRWAVGFRVYSKFQDWTKSQGNQTPMVLDLNVAAMCGFNIGTTATRHGPIGIGVWLHTGTVDGDAITGGRAFMLAYEAGNWTSDTPISASINFNRSVVIYPSFMAFNPLPLCVGVVAVFPADMALDIDGFCGDVSGRLYRSELEVFNPRAQ